MANWTEYKDRVDFEKVTVGNNPIIITDYFSKYTGKVDASGTATIDFDIVKTGYTPIGIIGFYSYGSYGSYIAEYAWWISDDKTLARLRFKNWSSSALVANDTTVRAYVAYIKD